MTCILIRPDLKEIPSLSSVHPNKLIASTRNPPCIRQKQYIVPKMQMKSLPPCVSLFLYEPSLHLLFPFSNVPSFHLFIVLALADFQLCILLKLSILFILFLKRPDFGLANPGSNPAIFLIIILKLTSR